MDLYRILRISLYLLVASSALALSIAEGKPVFLLGVMGFGALAYFTVDVRRVRPVRVEYALAMGLTLMLFSVYYIRDGWDRPDANILWERLPGALAHFLCALQVLLFFTAYRGSILLTFCACSTGVVLASSYIQPTASSLLRISCFVALLAWTLFIHALWRARENYNGRLAGVPAHAGAYEPRPLSERAFWESMSVSAGLSVLCLLLGLFLFLITPHLNESLTSWIDWIRRPDKAAKPPDKGTGGGGAGGGIISPREGFSPAGVDLENFGAIQADHKPAVAVRFSAPLREVAYRGSRLYLRGLVMSECQPDKWLKWLPQKAAREFSLKRDEPLRLTDPSAPAVPAPRREFGSEVQHLGLVGSVLLSAGPVLEIGRIDAVAVTQDDEGVLRPPGNGTFERYELVTAAPIFLEDLDAEAVAEHKEVRYRARLGLTPQLLIELGDRAHRITRACRSSVSKLKAILDYLKDPQCFEYTKDGGGVSIEQFILSTPQQKGRAHCTYFASAFVFLCRLNDIPARLVSGYCGTLDESQAAGRRYEFKNSDGHAWAEVFFKNVGWVTIEATPAARETTAPDPIVAKAPPAPHETSPQPPGGVSEQAWQWLLNYKADKQQGLYERVGGAVYAGLSSSAGAFSGASGFLGALFSWGLLAGLVVLLVRLVRLRARRPSTSGSVLHSRARAALAFYNDLLQVLSRRGFVRRPGQTPREFADFVLRRGGEQFKPVLTVTEIFESVRYGGLDITQDEFNRLQEAIDSLRELAFLVNTPVKT